MNNFIKYMVCFLLPFSFTSCDLFDDSKAQNESNDPKTIVELSDTLRRRFAEQDTIMTELVNKVDTLTCELNKIREENVKLEEQISTLKSPRGTLGYMALSAIILSIVSIILTLVKGKGVSKEKLGEHIRRALDNSQRLTKLQEKVDYLLSQRSRSTNPNTRYAPQDIDIRIKNLEDAINHIQQYINKSNQKDSQIASPKQSSNNKVSFQQKGYAYINSGNIFTKVVESAQEACVFSINFSSANEGQFSIISLDKIKSRNGWQEIVEYTGSIEDATNFNVEELGICKKYDDVWEVTKKLKIKLVK